MHRRTLDKHIRVKLWSQAIYYQQIYMGHKTYQIYVFFFKY